MKFKKVVFISVIMIQAVCGQSRERCDILINEITPKVQSILGQNYGVEVEEFDTTIGTREDPFYRKITDPYHTLAGCIFFRAYLMNEDGNDLMERSAVGMYKNRHILWMSDTIMAATWGGTFGAEDINNDGKVEIMTLWYYPNYIDKRSDMWIISWNGTSGKIINDYEFQFGVQSGGATSKIISYPQLFVVLDQNKNGIKQVRGKWSDNGYFPEDDGLIPTYPWITYCWNGNIYTFCSSNQQVPETAFLPSNQMTVIVRCAVSKDDSLRYAYTFNNDQKSEQSIAKITLLGGTQNYTTNEPYDWISLKSRRGHQGVFWMLPPRNPWIDQETRMAKPGETWSGFIVSSLGIPSIIKYYLQGYRRFPSDYASSSITDEALFQDMLSNSVNGFTIGPTDPPNPFVPLHFLDTLYSYIKQAHTFGWINNTRDDDCEEDEKAEDGIVKNLDKRLSNARNFIEKKQYKKAQQQLDKFLNKVEKLWKRQQIEEAKNKKNPKIIFTSEAYALLKFNGEYLEDHLPEKIIK